jgi:hypothetical protein
MAQARPWCIAAVSLLVLTIVCTLAGPLGTRVARADGCDAVVRTPRELHRAAAQRPRGAVICIRGTIRIGTAVQPKDEQRFVGPGRIRAAGGADEGFDLDKARGVVIHGLDIAGFQLRAIKCGRNARIIGNHIHHNGRNGIGGGHCAGLLIQRNEIERNGGRQHIGEGAAGVKLAGDADDTTVVGNHVHHNIGNGLWWDVDAKHALAARNVIVDNVRKGIHYEVSSGPAVFKYNVVRRNNREGHLNSAGIMVEGSQRVRVFGNRLGGNGHGGILVQSGRGFQLKDVWVRGNRLGGDDIRCQDGINIVCQRN